MLRSMTGFGSREAELKGIGKVLVELRSSNHKFLETVFHLPEGLISLEERLKRIIESRIKRGRVLCIIRIAGGAASRVCINKKLLRRYISSLKGVEKKFRVANDINLSALIHLPGVLSLKEGEFSKGKICQQLSKTLSGALDDLIRARQNEGRATHTFLLGRAKTLKRSLEVIRQRFKQAVRRKLARIKTDEERASFLKYSDISEEIERLSYHIKNLTKRLYAVGPIGKELDFITQEMQREANTIGAKSCASGISGKVIYIKSQIEKIREQLQNIE
ncbi:YicC/YloC family endoribonuclease [Candidatus Omnitrophota bacterium]